MKVLMNALSARRGGIFTYTRNLSNSIRDDDIEIQIGAAPALAEAIGERALSIDVSNMGPARRLAWEQSVWRRIVNSTDPDVLFSSANFALLGCKVPQLLLMREGGLFNPYYLTNIYPTLDLAARITTLMRRNLMIRSIKAATRVMFPSETLRDWVSGWVPEIAETGIVNRYGIDLTRFEITGPRPPLGDQPLKLLYVSVYYPHKDPCTLSRAVEMLCKSGTPAEAHITMEEAEFNLWSAGPQEYAELKRSEDRGEVKLGSVDYDELKRLYNSSSIFIFSSISETFGFPLVEAMACGLPVITADTMINREICGPAALYHTPQNPESLADRVRELAARPDLYQHLSREGRKRAEALFDLQRHLNGTIDNLRAIHRQK